MSDVRAAITVNDVVFWRVAPYSFVGIYQRFGGAFCLHLQGRINRVHQRWRHCVSV